MRLASFFMLVLCARAWGGVAMDLIWEPSPDTNAVGYIVYWGPTNGVPTALIVGMNLTASVSNLQAGVAYHFWVTAHDVLGQESEPSNVLRYDVPAENCAPVIEPIAPFSMELGAQAVVMVRATNRETNQVLVYTLDNPPAWATINPTNGRVTLAPTNTGVFTLTARVTDDGTPMLADLCSFTVTVVMPPRPRPPVNLMFRQILGAFNVLPSKP